MIREDIERASDDVLRIIIEQGQERLKGQCEFATAQETRAGALVGAGATLAAGAAAVVATAMGGSTANYPLLFASWVAMAGFTASAGMALFSLRSQAFHACGHYPSDFEADILEAKTSRQIQEDFALDLQIRLQGNAGALKGRGDIFNSAASVLIGTPLVAILLSMLAK